MHKTILYIAVWRCLAHELDSSQDLVFPIYLNVFLDFSCYQNVHLNSFIISVVQFLGLFKSKRNTTVYERNRDLLIQKCVHIALRVASSAHQL